MVFFPRDLRKELERSNHLEHLGTPDPTTHPRETHRAGQLTGPARGWTRIRGKSSGKPRPQEMRASRPCSLWSPYTLTLTVFFELPESPIMLPTTKVIAIIARSKTTRTASTNRNGLVKKPPMGVFDLAKQRKTTRPHSRSVRVRVGHGGFGGYGEWAWGSEKQKRARSRYHCLNV